MTPEFSKVAYILAVIPATAVMFRGLLVQWNPALEDLSSEHDGTE